MKNKTFKTTLHSSCTLIQYAVKHDKNMAFNLLFLIADEDEMPDDFSGFIVLDGDDSEAEIDDAEDKLVSLLNMV